MPRNSNYAAFYVAEPFSTSRLGAYATKDFIYYNMLKAWKGAEPSFPFTDAHETTYSVRDDSDWETTLKPRLRERLRNSKNIILFLSSNTKSSRAIKEEIDYGINDLGLPVIVIYPEYGEEKDLIYNGTLSQTIKNLWANLPIFRDSMAKVPTLHIPLNKNTVKRSLNEEGFMIASKRTPDFYWYKP